MTAGPAKNTSTTREPVRPNYKHDAQASESEGSCNATEPRQAGACGWALNDCVGLRLFNSYCKRLRVLDQAELRGSACLGDIVVDSNHDTVAFHCGALLFLGVIVSLGVDGLEIGSVDVTGDIITVEN